MIPERRGYIRVSLPLLEQALSLAPGMHIKGVIDTVDDRMTGDTVTFAVYGDACPHVPLGQRAPNLSVWFEHHENGRVSLREAKEFDKREPAAPVAEVVDPSRSVEGQSTC